MGESLFFPSIVFGVSGFRGSFRVSRHVISPVRQSISGLFSFSQGKPRMIFCFPRPVTSSFNVCFRPCIIVSSLTKCFMVPRLFSVPSTLKAFSGSSSFWISKPDFLA